MDLRTWWRNRKRRWPWIALAVLLALSVLGAIVDDRSPNPAVSAPTTTATAVLPPGLVGMTADQAQDALTAAGFDVEIESVDGRNVIVKSNWTVIAVVEGDPIVLRVDKIQHTTTNQPTPTTTDPVPSPSPSPEPSPKPKPNPQPEPEPVPEPEPEPDPGVYYANCAAARAAGAAPLYAGQPGYRPALDRDNDGIACDS
ncbi:excalibur calcium-binding domain-containing protein [Actinokineospora fastidiosa]|uniref:PASTA domain-containing protein n=1 Tax=Actinokineospora fastidiosa TaxID=1816 RepID=A0A918LC93_9PSEU|nr:excalibur calcium-binding domain-containing protein [Actinokineospora fastidiosa]GGS29163.1 hypothetical protein GCM10010171_23000 [Actinokineospora fastidiosa]